jgi:arylsulfatase A-like enzyme
MPDMKSLRIVSYCLALVCSAAAHGAQPASDAAAAGEVSTKPNIVVIFIDDMGYADIGPFGATKQKTPNLDRMAREGMKLTSFYAAPVCSVSRAQLLTGCYGARISVTGVYFPGQANGLNPAEHTIAERLKERGYATACIGKWHLGDQPDFLPTKQGFDRYFGIPYSNDMQRKAVGGSQRVTPLLRDDKVAELLTDEQQSRIVERYTDEATRFIRESKDRPFFLYFPHTAVHTPIWPGEAFRGKSANGRFGDWVEEVDWSVGRVLDTLRELKLDENTLVVFTSDNGPWLVKGADGGSALPLRGGKGSTWEGGVRVPTIARWPGKIEPSSVCDTVAGTIDLLPTFVSLAGGVVPAEPVIDGRDISAMLLGQTREAAREAHYYFQGHHLQAVRQGSWKLAIATQPETMGMGTTDDAKTNPRLYNLDEDIGEQTNVAAKHPEVVARLQSLADKIDAEIGSAASRGARRPAGQVANPTTLYPTEEPAPRPKPASAKGQADAKPVVLEDLKPGAVVASSAAPQIAGGPFTVACTVETEQADAILVAHGGLAAGYALHLRGGRVVFAVRHGSGDGLAEIVSPETIRGRTEIAATLSADRTMSLSVNGQTVATGKATSFIPRQPQEDLCLGHDNQNPVAAYSGKAPFQGRITALKITTP